METKAIKEPIWLLGLLDDLCVFHDHVNVHFDSQSAIQLAKNQVYYSKMKYIDVQSRFIRDILDESDILHMKIYNANNLTDILTKVV